VLVTRTFSKAYGLAGERVGWGTGSAEVIDALNRIRGPFNVTTPPRRALAARGDQAFVEHSPPAQPRVRARALRRRARGAGQPRPARRAERGELRAGPVRRRAERRGAYAGLGEARLHRALAARQGLPQALRITIGTAEQMDAIAAVLRSWRRPQMSFQRIAIIGLGLLGGSIGLAVREHLPASPPPAMMPIPRPRPRRERGLVGSVCETRPRRCAMPIW
jgi:histidinol-phosphate aminotransferase